MALGVTADKELLKTGRHFTPEPIPPNISNVKANMEMAIIASFTELKLRAVDGNNFIEQSLKGDLIKELIHLTHHQKPR